MKNYYLPVLLVLSSVCLSFAQSDSICPCCSENHRAFNFWVGDWNVYSNEGEVIGTNKVVSMQEGCVLQENWEASSGSNTGTSYNFFNAGDSTWNQIWISNAGFVLELKGNVNKDGAMILKSKIVQGRKGKYYNQITWSKSDNGSVVQRWDILDENNEPLSVAFEGIYKRKNTD